MPWIRFPTEDQLGVAFMQREISHSTWQTLITKICKHLAGENERQQP